jgi:hypothetical protein
MVAYVGFRRAIMTGSVGKVTCFECKGLPAKPIVVIKHPNQK